MKPVSSAATPDRQTWSVTVGPPVPTGNRHERRAAAAKQRRLARRTPREDFGVARVFYGGVEIEGVESVVFERVAPAATWGGR